MYDFKIHSKIDDLLYTGLPRKSKEDYQFGLRLTANAAAIHDLFQELYGHHTDNHLFFDQLLETIFAAYKNRPAQLKAKDIKKLRQENWFLSNQLAGMSLYVDRFCGAIPKLETKIPYFKELGVNLLHLMPLFESPKGE